MWISIFFFGLILLTGFLFWYFLSLSKASWENIFGIVAAKFCTVRMPNQQCRTIFFLYKLQVFHWTCISYISWEYINVTELMSEGHLNEVDRVVQKSLALPRTYRSHWTRDRATLRGVLLVTLGRIRVVCLCWQSLAETKTGFGNMDVTKAAVGLVLVRFVLFWLHSVVSLCKWVSE